MENFIGGLQVVLGAETANFALALINSRTPDTNPTYEIWLVIFGLIITTVGSLQWVKHLRFSVIQIFTGLAIIVASIFLRVDSNTGYGSTATFDWLIYAALAAGGITVIAVLAQFFLRGLKSQI